jgi:hypothetical protein
MLISLPQADRCQKPGPGMRALGGNGAAVLWIKPKINIEREAVLESPESSIATCLTVLAKVGMVLLE